MNKIDYQIVPLFSSPLFIKDDVIANPEEVEHLKSLEMVRMSSNNGDYTKDKYVLNDPKVSNLKNTILNNVYKFTFDELKVSNEVEFYLTNSWVVRHRKMDWAQQHVHTNSILSGIYYIDVGEKSGKLNFIKETSNLTVFPIHMDLSFRECNILNSRVWTFLPKNNQLFIFPPWLLHSVEKNMSDKLRYSLAFNVYIKGKIGRNEFQLEIK